MSLSTRAVDIDELSRIQVQIGERKTSFVPTHTFRGRIVEARERSPLPVRVRFSLT